MKQLTLLFALVASSLIAFPQAQIAVQSGTTANFYYSFAEAIVAAPSGATVYLPAGTFETENIVIAKPITIIGIGHNPDGNPFNGVSELIGDLKLREGASGSVIKGIYLTGSLRIGDQDDNQSVENITLSRVHVDGYSTYLSDGNSLWPTKNVVLSECIFDSFNGGYAQQVLIMKSIFKSAIVNLTSQATFRNNIFLYKGSGDTFYEIQNATFENNIFLCGVKGITMGQMLNNLFLSGVDTNFAVYNISASGNILDQTIENTFQNVIDQTFSYDYNYQLRATSPGVSAGTDGTHIGLFGTSQPYKVSGTPDVPHIDNYTINSSTDSQGRLYINIQVSAQSN